MTMNLTGFELKAGQQMTVKIEDDTAVDQIAKMQKVIEDLTARLAQVESDVEILYQAEPEEENDNPFAELDAVEDETDIWFPIWNQMPDYTAKKPFTFNFIKNRYNRNANDIAIEEYYERVQSWQLTDPKRYQEFKEHQNEPSNTHWDQSRFNIGDRVQLLYFLDDSPGYSYLKGKVGTVIGKQKGILNYLQVKFDGMDRIQNVIPGNVEKVTKDNKLPSELNPDLIIVEKAGYNGWIAYVIGFRNTWEYSDVSKSDVITKLLRTWYYNVTNR